VFAVGWLAVTLGRPEVDNPGAYLVGLCAGPPSEVKKFVLINVKNLYAIM